MMRPFAALCIAALCSILWPVQGAWAEVPTPESVLGHGVGDDFYLASYDEALGYMQALAKASDRVELRRVGVTSGGLDWYMAVISAPENLSRLDELRQISRRLAWARDLDDSTARQLSTQGKAIVHIDSGLHATEVAHAQHALQLAYDLASETEDPEILTILDEVVLLLWFSMNPDGQNMVVDWYRGNLGTSYEVAPLPKLYQKYVGHDNNRDGYMLNTLESRVTTSTIRHWEPQVLYNHHQTSPFPARIWIPPFAEPVSEFVHPLMWRTINMLGMSMAQALEERGQEGAMHMGTGFDNWYPGFIDHSNNFHNVAAFLTETGLYRFATPHFYTLDDFPEGAKDLRPGSLYSSPWQGGWWRLGDAVDYMLTASLSVLDTAAKYRSDLLYNRYQAGRDVIAQYRENPPYAYFVPQEQRDPVAAVELLRRLAFNGIEVHRLTEAHGVEGQTYAAGTWVIAMDQPFAHFVRQLFAVQTYPDLRQYPEGPPDQPYDVAGWTLPYQMDVRVIEARQPLAQDLRDHLELLRSETPVEITSVDDASGFDSPLGSGFDAEPGAAAIVPPDGRLRGSGSVLAVDGSQNNAYRALNRVWRSGGEVRWLPGTVGEAGTAGTSGRFLIAGMERSKLQGMVGELALSGELVSSTSGSKVLPKPRVGLYRPWDPSMDEGWTRWLLERFEFEFDNLDNGQMWAGELRRRYDVIVLADSSPNDLLNGFAKGEVPPRYVGGLGARGVRALDAFVKAGGTLVCFNQSSRFAIEQLHLAVENVVQDQESKDFFLAGSVVEMIVDPSQAVMTGMPSPAKVMVHRSPVFRPTEAFRGRVLAKYAAVGSPLLSGYLLGEEHLQGMASALDVHHGKGHVILFAARPQWRGQSFGTFRMLFNALLYGPTVASSTPDNAEFWQPPPSSDAEESHP